MIVEINNLTTTSIDEDFLRKTIEKVLIEEDKEKAELSIALVGPGRMKKINKKYRGKNRTTDVLSFPELEVSLDKFKVGPLQKSKNLGEIVVCLREIKKNAKKYKSDFKTELARVLIHGTLHLLGYDHEKSEKKAQEMEEKQNYYLSKLITN